MQKILSSKTTRIAAIIAGVIGLASLTGCGNSGGTSASGGTTPTVNATAITIDNAGVIPVFGNSSTSTVVYVHNNTNNTISGISYSSVVNSAKANSSLKSKLASLFKTNKSLTSVNGSQCSSIAAGQSCPLSIVTPVLSGSSTQGSMDVKASYNVNNKAVSFNQIINYAQVQNNLVTSGAKFKAGIDISGYGNPTGYATIYLYGSGQNQVYNVSSMTINKPAVTIVNGNISGHQIQSNFVQAVEVSSPILTSSISATITVNSSTLQANNAHVNNSAKSPNKSLNASKSLLTSDQFSNSVDLAVEPVAAGAILTTGLIPLLNTVSTTSGSLLVQNAGNQNAVLGSASADAGISNLSGCSGETLAPAASCTISFNVTESGGSGNITIPYTGGSASSIAANVTWFNGVGAALVSMSASNNPLTFSATVGGSTTVTVQNIGGYTLSNISIPAPVVVGGSATATLANNTCASIESLPVGISCSYDVQVADSATDLNQQINLGFSASYAGPNGTQTYSRVMPLAYSSTAYGAIIAISPTNPSLTISGNNFESTTQVLTISNSGNLPADISNTLSDNPAYLTESATTCGATLAAEASCTSTIQFGPTYSAAGASGASNYTVDYTAVGQTPSGSVVSSIDWTVQSYAQSISLTSVESSGAASGDGLSGTPYIFSGSSNASKLVTLTYTNTGTNSLKITGIQESNSVYAWSMPGDGNHCDNNVILPPNGTCSIQFENVLATNILALGASVGATYTENINVPTLTYQDADNSSVQFNAQPNLPTGGTTIYAQSNQATLSNSVTVNEIGTAYESVTITHLLANLTGYTDVFVTTQMEDYVVADSGSYSPTCASSSENGILTQTCTLSENMITGEGTYQVNQTLLNSASDLNLTALFSTNLPNQGLVLSMNPIFAITNLGKQPPEYGYAYITNSVLPGSITQCRVNPFTGLLTSCSATPNVQISDARQIALTGDYAYITSAGRLNKCNITTNVINNCSPLSNSPYNVYGIALNNNFVYFTGDEVGQNTPFNQIYYGSITDSGELSPLGSTYQFNSGFTGYGMAINGSYSYTLYSKVLTVSHNSVDYEYGVTSCVINQDGSLGQCVDIPLINGNDENIANQPTSIAFYNNHVYITNSASQPDSYGGDIVICAVDNNTGALSECTTQSIENNSSYGISALNDFAFITGDDGSSNVKTCKIEGNGSLTECVTSPGIDIGSPLGISIFMPPS